MAERSESPDVDSARDRLGNLLEIIRNRQITANGRKREDDEDSDQDISEEQQSPRRSQSRPGGISSPLRRGSIGLAAIHKIGKSPTKTGAGSSASSGQGAASSSKKRRRPIQKKIIFELRQKAFEIQNPNLEHGLYALCRIWMRGKHNKDSIVSGYSIDRSTVDSDQEALMAAKSIVRKSTVQREDEREDATEVTGDETTASDILDQYLSRWRRVKKEWCQNRNKEEAEKYGDSLRVLREMYASAQNHAMAI